MECRKHCGACCIAPSIKTPYFGMPNGKAAGEPCIHLNNQFQCRIWQTPHYPLTCQRFKPEPAFCGENPQQALSLIHTAEVLTAQ